MSRSSSLRDPLIDRATLEAVVTDDGRGFDPEAMFAAGGGDRAIGLLGMRERAELVGGDVTITSTAGKGTRVVCRLRANA